MADVSEPEDMLAQMTDMDFTPVPPEGVSMAVSPEALALTNPFGDAECVSMDLIRRVDPSQLAEEIGELAGVPVQVSVANPRPGTEIAPDNPFKLYVCPVVGKEVIERAVAAHEIDDLHGLTAEQRECRILVDKLRSGEELTTEELARTLLLSLAAG